MKYSVFQVPRGPGPFISLFLSPLSSLLSLHISLSPSFSLSLPLLPSPPFLPFLPSFIIFRNKRKSGNHNKPGPRFKAKLTVVLESVKPVPIGQSAELYSRYRPVSGTVLEASVSTSSGKLWPKALLRQPLPPPLPRLYRLGLQLGRQLRRLTGAVVGGAGLGFPRPHL